MDPLDRFNNLSRSVSFGNVARFRLALRLARDQLEPVNETSLNRLFPALEELYDVEEGVDDVHDESMLPPPPTPPPPPSSPDSGGPVYHEVPVAGAAHLTTPMRVEPQFLWGGEGGLPGSALAARLTEGDNNSSGSTRRVDYWAADAEALARNVEAADRFLTIREAAGVLGNEKSEKAREGNKSHGRWGVSIAMEFPPL